MFSTFRGHVCSSNLGHRKVATPSYQKQKWEFHTEKETYLNERFSLIKTEANVELWTPTCTVLNLHKTFSPHTRRSKHHFRVVRESEKDKMVPPRPASRSGRGVFLPQPQSAGRYSSWRYACSLKCYVAYCTFTFFRPNNHFLSLLLTFDVKIYISCTGGKSAPRSPNVSYI